MSQYGQHDVELVEDDTLEEGQYLLRFYNNNYWSNSTREDGYSPDLPDSVGTGLYAEGEQYSYVYFYLIDENAGTFTLVDSFSVPYSSVVSNAQDTGETYVVNSGVDQTFGEYDADGTLIRSYQYECLMNGYRVMKSDFVGFWFQS